MKPKFFYFLFSRTCREPPPLGFCCFILCYSSRFMSFFNEFVVDKRGVVTRGESFALIWIASFSRHFKHGFVRNLLGIFCRSIPELLSFLLMGFINSPLKKQKLAIALFALIFLILPSTSRKILHIDYNPEIKALAPSVQKEVPDSEKLLIYDDPTRDKHSSIFPPSTLFYTDRFLERLPYERTILIQTLQQKPYRPCLLTQFALQELKDLPLETVAQQGHLRLVRWKKEIPHD
jgi:hypothetical protein